MIGYFTGEHSFLSNFYPSTVVLDGHPYPTVEHAFQAAKSDNAEYRKKIRLALTPGEAKKLGQRVIRRPDWEKVKAKVMHDLLLQKFSSSPFEEMLLKTGDEEIVEGNYWHDNIWGICDCPRCGAGQNLLGKLLMRVRKEIREGAHDWTVKPEDFRGPDEEDQ